MMMMTRVPPAAAAAEIPIIEAELFIG